VRTRPKRGIRAGCPLGLFVWKDELPAIWALLDLRLIDIRPGGPVVLLAGIPGCDRLPGGDSRLIRVRDLCGMREKPAVERREKMSICRYSSGSDGTRTRDLRRDRPAF
jgi:hypothetical protein